MKMMKIVLLVWLCLSVLPAQCLCFSRGASTATCMDMKPGHISAQPQHTHTASAVTIHTSRTVYLPQHTLMVSVRSSRAFMGLLLHARSVVEDRVVGGKFTHHPPGTHTISCLSTADTVTHSDKLLKRNLSFTWRAPAQPSGDLRFYITVVHSYFVYWTRIHSAVVHDGTHKTRTGHNPGLQNGIISASPTSSAITLTHTSAHTHSEHSNTTHKLTSNFLTHTTLPQHHKHSHTDKHTSTHDPRNRVTQTQLYKTTHKQTHTPKGTKNLLHALTHTLSRPDNTYTPSHTQTHTATTPVTHTHTSSNIIPMSRSLTTPTPQTHTRSPTTACTSPGVTMVTLKMHTYSSHEYTPAPAQHTRSSNLLTHTSASTASPTTSSHTPSHTPTPTASHTLTHSSTVSHMLTVSHTPTHTPTASNTHTHTHTHMPTVSYTPTHTPTLSHLITHTRTGSYTPINTPLASNTPTHTLTMSHTLAPSSALHPKPSAALRRSVSDPVEPRDDPEVFVKPPDPEPHPESGTKTGGGVKAEPGARLVSQPVLLLALSLFLLVVLAVYVQRKHCIRRNGVSLSDSRQEGVGVRHVQECGELVQLRRIRENSLLLLQAQYDIITAPGN